MKLPSALCVMLLKSRGGRYADAERNQTRGPSELGMQSISVGK